MKKTDDINLWDSDTLLVGMVNGEAIAESSLANSYIKLWPSNPTPRDSPKGKENMCPHKYLYTNVHSRFMFIIDKKWK